ncbi:MAG: phosphotransferase family protein [Pseudomonadales bacterium]
MNQLLEPVLRREFQDFTALKSCQQLSAGASQETWRIRYQGLQGNDGEQQLALRRSQPTAVLGSSVGEITLETEAELFQLAIASGIPGPEVFYVLRPEDQLGSGFIMQWLDGETLGQRINKAPELADVRPRLARQCGEILGKIHKLEWRDTALADQLPSVNPAALVDQTWGYYRDLNVPVPMIDYTWRWLRDNLPSNSRHTLVHGDFRNGNLMVTPSGINAVLDWELAHIGDPMRDLGWLCVNSWRFGNTDLPVGGFGNVEELLAGYQKTSGVEVDLEALRFWQVFGSFWWAVTTLTMAHSWRTGETPSLERPVIGRRSSEAQMDCVNLLIPGDYSLPNGDEPIASGTQLPMPAELIEGVAVFLKKTIATQLAEQDDTHNQFLARVAANSLRIAQRELQYGSAMAQQENVRLKGLLQDDDDLDGLRWKLTNQLRDSLPLNTQGLAEHLRQTVAGQTFLDQPNYSALKK